MTKLHTTLILTYYTMKQKMIQRRQTCIFVSILNFSVLNLFCRWVADQTVAERLIDISGKVDDFWQKLPKSKQPKSKSYVNLHDAVIDLFTLAKLIFLATLLLFSSHF